MTKEAKTVSQTGRLVLGKGGALMLEVPVAMVKGLFSSISEKGISLPPSEFMGRVVVMTQKEVEKIGPTKITERGRDVDYQLGPLEESSGYQKGVSKIWWQEVKSKELVDIRRSYGLSDNPKWGNFRLLIAYRKKNVLRKNETSKLDTDLSPSPVGVLRIGIYRFSTKIGTDETVKQADVDIQQVLSNMAGATPAATAGGNPAGNILNSVVNWLQRYATSHNYWPTAAKDTRSIQFDIAQQNATHGVPENEAQEMHRFVEGIWRLMGMTANPEASQDFAAISQFLSGFAPHVASYMPEFWDALQGPVGSTSLLANRIAQAYQHRGLPPQLAEDTATNIINTFFSDNDLKASRGLTALQLGDLYLELAKTGRMPLNAGPQEQAAALAQYVGPVSAAREHMESTIGPQPMSDLVATVLNINQNRAPNDSLSLEERVRHSFNLQNLRSNKLLGDPSQPGALDADAAVAQDQALIENAGRSRLARDLAGIQFAVDNNLVAANSPAAKVIQDIRNKGVAPYLTTQDAIKLLEQSRIQGGRSGALAVMSSRHANLQNITPEIGLAVRGQQTTEIERRIAAQMSGSGRRHLNPEAREKLIRQNVLAQYGYTPSTYAQLHQNIQNLNPEATELARQEAAQPKSFRSPMGRIVDIIKNPNIRTWTDAMQHFTDTEKLPDAPEMFTVDQYTPEIKTSFDNNYELLKTYSNADFFVAAADDAATKEAAITGIPDRQDYGDLSKLRPGELLTLIAQEHDARRAKKHTDIRIGSPEHRLFSWAVRKGIPEPGQKHYGHLQPRHSWGYKDFEGTLPKGYGAGTVKKLRENKILITKAAPDAIHFTTADVKYPERFALVKMKDDKDWLLINATPTELPEYKKPKIKNIPADRVEHLIDQMQEGDSFQAKIDGARSLVKLLRNGIETTSYRTDTKGRPIVHTERMFGRRDQTLDLPKELEGSVLSGELYGERDGEAIPVQELGGLLNSTIAKSLTDQQKKNINLRASLFDVAQKGKEVIDPDDTIYPERRDTLKDILQYLPSDKFELSEEATTPDEAREMWDAIRTGQHPKTTEGIVYYPKGERPVKSKLTDEYDVHIKDIFPGEGKYKNIGAGGIVYSRDPEPDKIVGRVGTGFSDDLRKELWQNKQDYIGRTARVKSQAIFPSGALRAPSFISLHEG